MVADGISGGNTGFYGAMQKKYSTIGNTGMTKSEFTATLNQQSAEYRMSKNVEATATNIRNLQQVAGMYGMQLDTSSIFALADKNGNGVITTKEANSAMSKLGQMAWMNQMSGGQSGGSGVMGMLNSITDTAGNIGGMLGGNSGGNSSSGGIDFLNSALNSLKKLWS